MKTSTAYNHLVRFKRILDSIYSRAISCKLPHSRILELKEEIHTDLAWKKCPAWVREIIGERGSNHLDRIHREWVVWAFLWEGKLYRSWLDIPEAGKEQVRQDKLHGDHYWLDKGPRAETWEGETLTVKYTLTRKPF